MLDVVYSNMEISPSFDADYEKFTHDLAKRFYALLVKNILTNKFGFSNAASTVKRKGKNLPLVDTMQYVNRIVVSGNKVYVQEGTHASGISFGELSDWLEYGRRDRGFDGYPVWRKTREEFDLYMIPATEAFVYDQITKMK
jgi:hypothetical protein